MQKFKLPELSIIIHYRKDSEDREFNLKTTLKFITDNFEARTIIVVNDEKQFNKSTIPYWVEDKFDAVLVLIQNEDQFKKSFSFNQGAKISTGEVLCFWDVDVLISPEYILKSYNDIVNNCVDHIYPFNGTFIDVQKPIFKDQQNFDLNDYYIKWKAGNENFHFASDASPGGCTMISREAFERMNGYDERFVGWGFEDTDFRERSLKVNNITTLNHDDAICWHLHHDDAIRMENPNFHQNMQIYNQNLR